MHELTRVDLHEAPGAPVDAATGGRGTRRSRAGGAAALALVALLRRKKDTP